jgi:hypothetical protein
MSVAALMAVMLAISIAPALAKTNPGGHYPYDTAYPNSNYNVENMCNVNPGRFHGSSQAAQC